MKPQSFPSKWFNLKHEDHAKVKWSINLTASVSEQLQKYAVVGATAKTGNLDNLSPLPSQMLKLFRNLSKKNVKWPRVCL